MSIKEGSILQLRFEKFERKFNFQLPDSYKLLVTEYGDDYIIGNCEFYSSIEFINNNLRLGGAMEVNLFPFGGLGNGDCFCFLKYGENPGEYYIVLWLHENYSYVILNSTFDNFIYNCVLQEYKTLLYPEEYMAEGTKEEYEECIDKINCMSVLLGFDVETMEKARNNQDLSRMALARDPFAVQLLCIEGRNMLEKGILKGKNYLEKAMCFAPEYTAPYYLLGNYLLDIDKKEALKILLKGAKTQVISSGYSYWEEDDAGIPENVLEYLFDTINSNIQYIPDEFKDSPYIEFIRQERPYDPAFRFVLAEKFLKDGDYVSCTKELNNVLILSDDSQLKIKVLEMLIPVYERCGLVWASGVCRRDIKFIKGLKQMEW